MEAWPSSPSRPFRQQSQGSLQPRPSTSPASPFGDLEGSRLLGSSLSCGSLSRPGTSQASRSRRRLPRRLPRLEKGQSALGFDDMFRLSFSRAVKRMAEERKQGQREKIGHRTKHDRKQYMKNTFERIYGNSLIFKSAWQKPTESRDTRVQTVKEDESPATILDRPKKKKEIANESKRKSLFKPHGDDDISVVESTASDLDWELADILTPPDKQEALRRLEDNSEWSNKERDAMEKIFFAHQYEGSAEIHRDDLAKMLDFLGYIKIEEDAVNEMVDSVTGFSTLNFDEYMSFMGLAKQYEREAIRKNFQEADEDGSGELEADELEGVLKSIGITPFRSTIAGALAVVDEDGSGSLCFEEFVQLIMTYRKTEGFARTEVMKLHRVFGRFCEITVDEDGASHKCLMPDKMKDALLNMFGTQALKIAENLAGKLMEKPPKALKDKKHPGQEEEVGLTFKDFLVWSRRLREAEVEMYLAEFKKADDDGTGALEPDEIMHLLTSLGYMPLRSVIYDLIDTFDTDGGGSLDFDEFVNMMELFRRAEGFTRQELAEFSEIFKNFDSKNEGEIDVPQVGAMLRNLGFNVEMAKAKAMVNTVDWNGSGSLDFSEFLKLMRLTREDELSRIKTVYDHYKREDEDGNSFMRPADVCHALLTIGCPQNIATVMLKVFLNLCGDHIDIDALVGVADGCRRILMKKTRKHAGFSDERVEHFSKVFRGLDANDNGQLGNEELVVFCKQRGLSLATKADQKYLVSLIDEARANARQEGVSEEEAGPEGSRSVTFYTFLHLQRLLQTHEDRKNAEENKTKAGHSFNAKEVNELKVTFEHLIRHREHEDDRRPKDRLSLEELWVVLRQMGVTLTPMIRDQVKAKLFMDIGNNNEIQFDAFLKLVSWLVNSDIVKD
eukprot:TRINITY_DN23897_c0_g1_i2.p1 TRINITY_DN23897_c0_g1~~TRINITY_DN23897_c0_g1_i2.p1  ORF type:complete len:972 (+),score=192.10 TRINITY_DN23897_c0_g1_i2:228-2918(+)